MAQPSEADRRDRTERRENDSGRPFGEDERRLHPDRRHPYVEDLQVDEYIEIHAPPAPGLHNSADDDAPYCRR
jgi:hypothetical protein